MITKEDLEKNYAKLSNSELMNIIDRKFEYTELAVTVAISELSKRNIEEQDIVKYKEKLITEFSVKVEKNFIDDLTVFQKAMFFIFWLPIFTFSFKNNYKREGYILKLNQARYFSLIGFISCLIAVIIEKIVNLGNVSFPAFIAILFCITLHYDQTIRRSKRLSVFTHEPIDENESTL